MLQGILSTDAAFGVSLQHLGQQIQSRGGHLRIAVLGESKIASPILSEYFVVLLALEDRGPEEQVVEDDASRKDVADGIAFGAHIPNVDDLGSHEARCAAPDKKILLLVGVGGQAEVADGSFPALLFLEHDVLGLQVSMDYSILGQVGQSSEDILYYLFCIVVLDLYSALP